MTLQAVDQHTGAQQIQPLETSLQYLCHWQVCLISIQSTQAVTHRLLHTTVHDDSQCVKTIKVTSLRQFGLELDQPSTQQRSRHTQGQHMCPYQQRQPLQHPTRPLHSISVIDTATAWYMVTHPRVLPCWWNREPSTPRCAAKWYMA